jgi:small subunit ribosomal protein S16
LLRIRLRRLGKKRQPYYRIVVAERRERRDGDFIEMIGSYNPHADPPVVQVDGEKVKSWISKGAQPSEAAEKVLRRAGVLSSEK